MDLVRTFKEPKQYIIDQLIQDGGHEVLRLPPYQCDLNAIEEVWKDVKMAVAAGNDSDNIDKMMDLAKNVMMNYQSEK